MRRDRKIVNKAELTRLQRKFESCVGQLLSLEHSKTSAAQLINMLYNIVDRIYIGHIPDIGADALTGVGVCMPLIMIVSAFAALVGYGGAPRASIFMGKQDRTGKLRYGFPALKASRTGRFFWPCWRMAPVL